MLVDSRRYPLQAPLVGVALHPRALGVSWFRYNTHSFGCVLRHSVFGEDALVNVSVEKKENDGKLAGYIRIRSKTQGIALSLGDRITNVQRGLPEPKASD